MEQAFWQQRWQQNQTGFHLDRVNPALIAHWGDLNLPGGSTVLVPLCGKSLDLIWLAGQGHHVIGVECSELAVQAFFDEQKLAYRQADYKGFSVFNADNISILKGDYFDLDKELLEDVAAVYDRASLVAMPADMRKKYAELLKRCLPAHSQMLLITLNYDQQRMPGPPFAVSDGDVEQLYGDDFRIRPLLQQDILPEEQRFAEKGLDYLVETVFHLRAR